LLACVLSKRPKKNEGGEAERRRGGGAEEAKNAEEQKILVRTASGCFRPGFEQLSFLLEVGRKMPSRGMLCSSRSTRALSWLFSPKLCY